MTKLIEKTRNLGVVKNSGLSGYNLNLFSLVSFRFILRIGAQGSKYRAGRKCALCIIYNPPPVRQTQPCTALALYEVLLPIQAGYKKKYEIGYLNSRS